MTLTINYREMIKLNTQDLERHGYPMQSRPRRRSECPGHPCPYVSCKYHLYLSVDERAGSLVIEQEKMSPLEMEETCLLETVQRRPMMNLEEIGDILGLTRERIRQIEKKAIAKLQGQRGEGLEEYAETDSELWRNNTGGSAGITGGC